MKEIKNRKRTIQTIATRSFSTFEEANDFAKDYMDFKKAKKSITESGIIEMVYPTREYIMITHAEIGNSIDASVGDELPCSSVNYLDFQDDFNYGRISYSKSSSHIRIITSIGEFGDYILEVFKITKSLFYEYS